MKRIFHLLLLAVCCLGASMLVSCAPTDDEVLITDDDISNQRTMIVGKWLMSGTQEYWRFDSTGYGENWDKSEDVNEGEGNAFKWGFEQNGLMIIYKLNGSYSDPEPDAPYIINSITSSRMTWTTNNGKGTEQSFTKVQ